MAIFTVFQKSQTVKKVLARFPTGSKYGANFVDNTKMPIFAKFGLLVPVPETDVYINVRC